MQSQLRAENNPLVASQKRFLFFTPLCPFARMLRLGLLEKNLPHEPWEEHPGSLSKDLYALSPEGSLPVLLNQDVVLVKGYAAMEYLEETYARPSLLGTAPQARAEARRLTHWFSEKLFYEVTAIFLQEKLVQRGAPRRAPNSGGLQKARECLKRHLEYIGWLFDRRRWLAGTELTWADIAAASQLSCIDYFGDVPWSKYDAAKQWYLRIKSRPSFRPILLESFVGLSPSTHYRMLDF